MLLLRSARGARIGHPIQQAPVFEHGTPVRRSHGESLQHRRGESPSPSGPWSRMRDKVVDAVDGRAGTILDLASGPGEPAATVAEALPSTVRARGPSLTNGLGRINATSHLSNIRRAKPRARRIISVSRRAAMSMFTEKRCALDFA